MFLFRPARVKRQEILKADGQKLRRVVGREKGKGAVNLRRVRGVTKRATGPK